MLNTMGLLLLARGRREQGCAAVLLRSSSKENPPLPWIVLEGRWKFPSLIMCSVKKEEKGILASSHVQPSWVAEPRVPPWRASAHPSGKGWVLTANCMEIIKAPGF